jgi:hypothetical protein
MGASLLILANKRDLPNCISLEDIETVIYPYALLLFRRYPYLLFRPIRQRYFLVAPLLGKMSMKEFLGWFMISVINDIISIDDRTDPS